jgi:hypothetical protein
LTKLALVLCHERISGKNSRKGFKGPFDIDGNLGIDGSLGSDGFKGRFAIV